MTIPDYIMEFWYISNTKVGMLSGDNPKMYKTADDQNIHAKVDAYLKKSKNDVETSLVGAKNTLRLGSYVMMTLHR
jgi:hypothetical protein